MRKHLALALCLTLCATTLAACGNAQSSSAASVAPSSTASSAVSSQIEYTSLPEVSEVLANQSAQPKQAVPSKPASSAPASQTPAPDTQAQAVRVTIPEGFTFMQIAARLEKNGVCKKADFYKAAQAYQVQSFSVPTSANRAFRLEGYLFPATYDFKKGQDPESVLTAMLRAYANNSGMPSDKELILASIIENEARSTKHMQLVSSVFHNRLQKGMRLEADSTRAYVNENITGNSLLGATSQYAAVYNTYKCKALPAGPICSPGLRAIKAAQSPAASQYLFFFFGNDNDNHYATTLEEHNAQIKKYGVQYGH